MTGEGGAEPAAAKPKSELFLRVISAIVLAIGAVGSAWWGGWLFALAWIAAFTAIGFEWFRILGAHPHVHPGWKLGGVFYSVLPAAAALLLRGADHAGLAAILFLFAIVWGADVGAYFAGRTFGGPKLAPAISPKKTWSGLIGGILTATIAGLALLNAMGVTPRPAHAAIALVLALASAAGDLFESAFKRKFGVKDSGNLIPGHGGFMDRLDGFIFAVTLAALIGAARGGWSDVGGGLIANW